MRAVSRLSKKLSILLTFVVLAAAMGAFAPPGHAPEFQPVNPNPLPIGILPSEQAIADFDGDRLPDRAELVSSGFRKNIHLTFSSSWAAKLPFLAETGQTGSIHAEDIDHDNDSDLIWISDQQTNSTALWLNNGIGAFARVNDPAEYTAEIKQLIGPRNQSSAHFSSGRGHSKAAITSGYSLPAWLEDQFIAASHSGLLKVVYNSWVAALSPCITHYPKRGPPSLLS